MEIPHGSMYGFGTARALAKLFGILANGGRMGDRVLLSSNSLPKLNEVVASGMDRIFGFNMSYGLGLLVGGSQRVSNLGHRSRDL